MLDNGIKNGWGKFWEIAQSIGAGAGILALQSSIAEALSGTGKKVGKLLRPSNEEAYVILMAKLETSAGESQKNLAALISKNINEDLDESQKKRFRMIFGRLSQIDNIENPQTEEKTNLAVELLKSFANYTSEERLEVYRAMGVMESGQQKIWQSANQRLKDVEQGVVGVINATSDYISGEPYQGLWAEMKKTFMVIWPKK